MPRKKAAKNSVVVMPRTKRLTREQSKAQTRALLMEVGRQHIMRDGLGDAVAERIAEDAGYSRGAFYANFTDKETLFIAIMQQTVEQRLTNVRLLLEQAREPAQLLQELRDKFADDVTTDEWVRLEAEFDAAAIRNEEIRKIYVTFHHQMDREIRKFLRELAKMPGISLKMDPNEIIQVMSSFCRGLAVRQRLLGSELPLKGARRLVCWMFDMLISVG